MHPCNRRVLAANFGRRKGWAGGIQALGGTTGSTASSTTSSSSSAALGMSEAYDKASVERIRLQHEVKF
jgi:hypothetical protein